MLFEELKRLIEREFGNVLGLFEIITFESLFLVLSYIFGE